MTYPSEAIKAASERITREGKATRESLLDLGRAVVAERNLREGIVASAHQQHDHVIRELRGMHESIVRILAMLPREGQ